MNTSNYQLDPNEKTANDAVEDVPEDTSTTSTKTSGGSDPQSPIK